MSEKSTYEELESRVKELEKEAFGHKQAKAGRLADLSFFEDMDRIDKAIRQAPDLEQMMNDVLETVLEVFNCDRAWLIFPCDPHTPTWSVPMERTRPEYPGAFAMGKDIPTSIDMAAQFKAALESMGPLVFDPTSENPMPDSVKQFSTRSAIIAAIQLKIGKPWLWGISQCSYARVWTKEEQRLFKQVGRQIADTLSVLLFLRNLQESEERYRGIVEDQTELVCRFLPDGTLSFVNDAYCRYFDKEKEALVGKKFMPLIPEEDRKKVEKGIGSLNKKNPVMTHEHRVFTPKGEIAWQQWTNRAIFDDQGNLKEFQAVGRDITNLEMAEQALRESEELYRLLVNNLPGFVFKGFRDYSVEFYDNRVERLTGYNMHVFNSGKKKWSDLIVTDDVEPARRAFVRALKTDKFYVRDYRIKTSAGDIIWIQERGYIVCSQNGDIEYVSGVFYDVTELKTAEEELKRSRALLHSTVESLPFDFFAIGMDGRYILQNTAGKARWGNLVGKRPEDLAVKSDKLDAWLQANRRAFSGETVKSEVEYIRQGKREIHHSVVAPIVGDGEILGILGATIDITDRKLAEEGIQKSEKKYRDLYQGLRDGFAAVTMEGTFTEFNPAFQRMLGYSEAEIYRLTIKDITPERWHPVDARIIEEQVLKRGFSNIYEKEFIKKDGTIFPVELRVYLVQDDEGNPERMWATIRDVTDRKATEKQLLHFQKMDAVGTLAGGIAHDFNNLLQAIQGYTDLLMLSDRDKREPIRRELEEISRAAKRGAGLTRQLLTFSRKVESNKLLLDLNRAVRQAKNLLGRTIPKMIEIQLHLAEPLKTIDADPSQVEQVIMNLAINAKDAMPEGGRLIIRTENASLDEEYCRTHLGARPGDYVLLTVSDTGHGMNRGTLDRIFEPFFTTKEVGKGTGLGLAIVYGIVKSHHGYITCYSEPGAGTSFKIYFPAMDKEAGPEEQEIEVSVKGGTETVLLVDDEDAIRDLGKQILEKFGYNVLTAVDGESALDLYRREQGRIDLVILDLIMPGMGGMRCLEELLKSNARAKVVIASGYSDTGPVKETIEKGAKNFIGKPYVIRKMLEMVRQVIDEN
ncbi:MAG: PAS domain S-box protein [Desulfobacterales bacterium]|nr:PAS domain S-box protein [Desulfobacterales bacterium]